MNTHSKTPIGIGIVGCGTISEVHAQVISQLSDAKLISAYSRTPLRLEAFTNRFDIKGYADYNFFLADKKLDAVVICTPNGTHLDYGIQAANAGKHLIVEKPLEITTKRAQELINHCHRNDVQLAVIYQNRFHEAAVSMKYAIDTGQIGKIVMARASIKWYRDDAYYKKAPWRGTLELDGGGALINQGIHTVDLLCWMAGPVSSIQAYKATLTHEGITGEDTLSAALLFKNGALGVLEASTSIVPAQNRVIEVNGTKGTVLLDGEEFRLYDSSGQLHTKSTSVKKKQHISAGSAGAMAGFSNGLHLAQYQSILEHFEKGTDPVVSGKDSLLSLAVVEAAYYSAKHGNSVSIADFVKPKINVPYNYTK
jgi:predicted dehydrogenase